MTRCLIATNASTHLRILASIDPRLWDVLLPRARVGIQTHHDSRHGLFDPSDNDGTDFQFHVQLAVRDLTRRIVDAAAAASAQARDGAAIVRRTFDEWASVCDGDSTGRMPLKLFFPKLWWVDLPGGYHPDDAVDVVPALAVAAWSLLAIGKTVRDVPLSQAIDTAVGSILSATERAYSRSHPSTITHAAADELHLRQRRVQHRRTAVDVGIAPRYR